MEMEGGEADSSALLGASSVGQAPLPQNMSETMLPVDETHVNYNDAQDMEMEDEVMGDEAMAASETMSAIDATPGVAAFPTEALRASPAASGGNLDPTCVDMDVPSSDIAVQQRPRSESEVNTHGAALFRKQAIKFLNNHHVFELIPDSGRVVVLDSELAVKHAFFVLHDNNITHAPVWNSKKRYFIGMLTVTDFIDILMVFYEDWQREKEQEDAARARADDGDSVEGVNEKPDGNNESSGSAVESKDAGDGVNDADEDDVGEGIAAKLGDHRISYWSEVKFQQGTSVPRLLTIPPESSLYDAIRLLSFYRVHRLCVVQRKGAYNTVLCVLTHHSVLKLLRDTIPNHSIHLALTVRELGIGTFGNTVNTCTYETSLIDVLRMLSTLKVSGVPVVDENGKAVDCYTRSDVLFLATDKSFNNMHMTVREALSKHQGQRCVPTCTRDDMMRTVFDRLIAAKCHRLICLTPDGAVDGIITISDILYFFLQQGPDGGLVHGEGVGSTDTTPLVGDHDIAGATAM